MDVWGNCSMFLDIGGQESLVVLDTDYLTSGLVCTCQELSLFVLRGHRVSCSILQRNNTEDAAVTARMTTILNTQLEENSFEFEFDKINHVSYKLFNLLRDFKMTF